MWDLPSSTQPPPYRRWMELMAPPLISLCKVFYFCWLSQSSGLDVFMTQLDVNVSFPHSAASFSPLLPPRNSTLIYCWYLSFPHLYGTHRATGGRIRAENCLLFDREHKKWAQNTTGTQVFYHPCVSALLSHCWSIAAGKGELPFPSALKQLIKQKAI